MKMKKLLTGLAGLLALTATLDAPAFTNTCQNVNGSPTTFQFNFNQQINSPIIAPGNTYLDDFFSWVQSSSPPMFRCDCDTSDNDAQYAWATGLSSLTPAGSYNGKPYYYINEYLDAAVKIDRGIGAVYVPFVVDALGTGSSPTVSSYCRRVQSTPLLWGMRGTLSLRVKRPFIGEVDIPSTEVARIHVSWKDQLSTGSPVARVVLSGRITVPENCVINAGQVINVRFDDADAGDFSVVGQRPASVAPKINTLSYTCQGNYGNKNIEIRFIAEADPSYSPAIKTTNGNIGIVIEDNNGTVIPPNSGRLPIALNPVTNDGSVTIKSYPVSTTGNTPALGAYSGTATIRVEFQ